MALYVILMESQRFNGNSDIYISALIRLLDIARLWQSFFATRQHLFSDYV